MDTVWTQSVEKWRNPSRVKGNHNPLVAGSNPAGATKFLSSLVLRPRLATRPLRDEVLVLVKLMERVEVGRGIVVIRDVLSAAECEALIARAEAMGFEPVTINTRSGARRDEQTRDNDRVIMDDAELALDLWKRVATYVPVIRAGRQVVGLNERLRLYRYHPGQKFDWHVDGPFRRGNGEMSLLTLHDIPE